MEHQKLSKSNKISSLITLLLQEIEAREAEAALHEEDDDLKPGQGAWSEWLDIGGEG